MSNGVPPQQAELAEFVPRALARYPLTRPHASYLANSFNTIYRVRADEGDFSLRVNDGVRIHHPEAARAEEAFTSQLSDAGIPVPRTVRTRDGDVAVIESFASSRRATVRTWVTGVPLHRPVRPEDVVELGSLCARMHAASEPTPDRPVGVLDARSVTVFHTPDLLHTASEPERSALLAAAIRGGEWLDERWRDADEPPRVLHFDLTPRNVLMDPMGRLHPIDFEDLAWGHRFQDIGHTLYGVTGGTVDVDALGLLRRGYRRYAPWPDITPSHLAELFAIRRLMMVNLALTLQRPGRRDYVAQHARQLSSS